MATVRIGGRKYSDPDVISLISETGDLIDPRSAVINGARQMNAEYKALDPGTVDAMKRILIMASIRNIQVTAMDIERRRTEKRDAVLISTTQGKQVILYNPHRPNSRIAFSIAHEIAHTIFPNSASGARFRNIHALESKEATELERLCDLGASELLMPIDEFQKAAKGDFYLTNVNFLANAFGSSFEATVYRLATAHPMRAVAGLLQFRLTW